ncbi:nesprin-1 [Caerostris extrusa]|uniref:Nesprin-1 n=1 Tax=Caerostris extrusa TaxID=172846 RepID=A0AAV4P5Q0_CAEEX|nr:nesprin-1 [Caerostris extrusa]
MQKEVVEIENKSPDGAVDFEGKRGGNLGAPTEKWTKFNFKLEGFRSNVDNVIDRLKEILSRIISSEVRLKEIRSRKKHQPHLFTGISQTYPYTLPPPWHGPIELHSEIREQKQVLVNLETESQELATDQPDSANVKQIIGQLTNLKGRLHTLEETVITQRNIIAKNLDEIKNVKDILKSERDELKAAELKVEAGLPALASLKDARDKKQDSEVSLRYQTSINSAITVIKKINYLADVGTQTTKELSDASIQCEFIQLQDQWREIAQTIQGWIEQCRLSLPCGKESASSKEEVIKWLEITEETNSRRHLIHLGSSIAEQEQLLKTIDTFTHWEEDVKIQLHKFDDIFVDQIEAVLKNIELLRTENDSRRSDFNGIYEEVKKLSDSHDTSEIEEITAMYSKLSELYQNTEELLSRKQKFLQKRLDFESWYKDMHENIDLLKSKVEGKKYTSDELQTATDELSNLQKEYEKKVNEVENLDEMAEKVNQVIRDRSTTLPVSVGDRLAHIERLLKTVRDLLTLEQEGLSNLNKKWDEFNSKYEAFCELHKEMEDQQAAYSIVHQLGRSLIEEDSSSFTTIQGYLTATDKQWEQDVSADDEAILLNHENCKQLEAEISAYKDRFEKLDAKVAQTKQKHSKLDTSYVEKENSNLQKRYEKVKGTASKIANFLSSSVERRYQMALQDYQRWMLTNTEKAVEIESNLVQGENKKTKLEVTAANIIQVLPPERHPEVQSVVDQCGKSQKEKLILKKKNLDDLLSIIQEICAENPEARLKTQTSEVTSRYQALERTLQETLRRLENLLKVKKEYETSKVTLQNWLQEMDKQLESNFDVSGDKEALQSKLQSLKDLLSKKEQNTPILSSVTDAGELIYLSLSMEGRDQIRKEMRCLRDSWDEKWEKVSTTIKNIESALMAWGTFEESCKQVGVWLNELSGQMGSEVQLKPTLAEKKLQLQSFKAVAQGILAYQTVITKLKDKASTLPESAPKHNVESFQAQYDSLISSAKDRVQICDQHVVEHENMR